jgi:cephalosporin hydroxylase
MKLVVDTALKNLVVEDEDQVAEIPLFSNEAFNIISKLWLKIGWNQKYSYTFTWLGRPIIQLPEDMIRVQEVIYRVKPDLIVEIGIAHGGSLFYYAGLLNLIGKGRVVGVDIEIRPQNREVICEHALSPFITMIEGDSIDPAVLEKVKAQIHGTEKVMVLLDGNHTGDHVSAELEAYAPLVTKDSYIVATDGVMKDLWDVPRGELSWRHDNPATAAEKFAARHPEFVMEQPTWPFNESTLMENITYWPSAYLRRRKSAETARPATA